MSQEESRSGSLISETSRRINGAALFLCVGLTAADFIVVMLEVISRSAGSTFSWTEEFSRWLLVWITFIGSAVLLREGGHIRVAFFISICPPRFGKVIAVIGELGVLMFLGFFVVLGFSVAMDALQVQGDIITIPMFFPKFGMVLGGVLLFFNEIYVLKSKISAEKKASGVQRPAQ